MIAEKRVTETAAARSSLHMLLSHLRLRPLPDHRVTDGNDRALDLTAINRGFDIVDAQIEVDVRHRRPHQVDGLTGFVEAVEHGSASDQVTGATAEGLLSRRRLEHSVLIDAVADAAARADAKHTVIDVAQTGDGLCFDDGLAVLRSDSARIRIDDDELHRLAPSCL